MAIRPAANESNQNESYLSSRVARKNRTEYIQCIALTGLILSVHAVAAFAVLQSVLLRYIGGLKDETNSSPLYKLLGFFYLLTVRYSSTKAIVVIFPKLNQVMIKL